MHTRQLGTKLFDRIILIIKIPQLALMQNQKAMHGTMTICCTSLMIALLFSTSLAYSYGQQNNTLTISFLPNAATQGNRHLSIKSANITQGTIVTWVNSDTAVHTVTNGQFGDQNSSAQFDSGFIEHSQQFSHAFLAKGSFPYFCKVHPFVRGEVNVGLPNDDSGSLWKTITHGSFYADVDNSHNGTLQILLPRSYPFSNEQITAPNIPPPILFVNGIQGLFNENQMQSTDCFIELSVPINGTNSSIALTWSFVLWNEPFHGYIAPNTCSSDTLGPSIQTNHDGTASL